MRTILVPLVALASTPAAVHGGCEAGSGSPSVVYHEVSRYNDIYVCRDGSVVSLRFGSPDARLTQSQVDLDDKHRLLLEYSRLCFAGFFYQPKPRKILVVGLGGGVLPREFHHYYPEATVDVVEIDPAIPPVARKFFEFPTDPRIDVHIADGREFVQAAGQRSEPPAYDLILLDAYGSEKPPFHLQTKEFLTEVKAILADDGVVLGNLLRSYRLFDSQLKTYLEVFGRCQAYPARTATNTIVAALGPEAPVLSEDGAIRRARRLSRAKNFTVNLVDVARRLRTDLRPADDARVLTDAMRSEK